MLFEHPTRLLIFSTLLMAFGVVMPFLMVIKMVESTFFLNFLSYAASITGFFLGFISIAAYRVKQKKKDKDNEKDGQYK